MYGEKYHQTGWTAIGIGAGEGNRKMQKKSGGEKRRRKAQA
jgi:hypothetical protein